MLLCFFSCMQVPAQAQNRKVSQPITKDKLALAQCTEIMFPRLNADALRAGGKADPEIYSWSKEKEGMLQECMTIQGFDFDMVAFKKNRDVSKSVSNTGGPVDIRRHMRARKKVTPPPSAVPVVAPTLPPAVIQPVTPPVAVKPPVQEPVAPAPAPAPVKKAPLWVPRR